MWKPASLNRVVCGRRWPGRQTGLNSRPHHFWAEVFQQPTNHVDIVPHRSAVPIWCSLFRSQVAETNSRPMGIVVFEYFTAGPHTHTHTSWPTPHICTQSVLQRNHSGVVNCLRQHRGGFVWVEQLATRSIGNIPADTTNVHPASLRK